MGKASEMKERLSMFAYGLLAILLFAAIIGFDVFRWHVFQDVTDSDVGYWKWRLLIDVKK